MLSKLLLHQGAGLSRFSARHAGRFTGQKVMSEAGGAVGKSASGRYWRFAVAGSSAVGLGGLCYYSSMPAHNSLFSEASIGGIAKLSRQRIQDTYVRVLGGLGITAAAATLLARNPRMWQLILQRPTMFAGGSFVGTLALGMGVQVMKPGVNKDAAFAAFTAFIGATLVPLTVIMGEVLAPAAILTGGLCGGLSLLAALAPSDKFLNWRGVLSMGLGAMFVGCCASFFVPMGSMAALHLNNFIMYGGLLLFSGLFLYNTQNTAQKAMKSEHFDVVNNAIHLYMDVLNIFIRLAMMMSGQRRK